MTETLPIEPLTRAAFARFGDVIEFDDRESYSINQGMAERFHAQAKIELAGDAARAVISLVQSRLFPMPHRVDHLEYHPYGSQAFFPLDATPFIVVVAAAGAEPGTIKAFQTNGGQGINYHTGTWHHVLLTPFAVMRFICVDRDSPDDNCVEAYLPESAQRLLRVQ